MLHNIYVVFCFVGKNINFLLLLHSIKVDVLIKRFFQKGEIYHFFL
jgi:hypothetical protein